jgi:hypothetical protein
MARDFTRSIQDLAQKLCVGVSTFGPLIEQNWGSSPEVMAALAWAKTACTIVGPLKEALDDAAPSDPIPEDPADYPGVDPSAPPFVFEP